MEDFLAAWHPDHLAETAWTLFGVLVLLVLLWKQAEPRLRAYVATTPTDKDDEAVSRIEAVVSTVSRFIDILSLFAPRAVVVVNEASKRAAEKRARLEALGNAFEASLARRSLPPDTAVLDHALDLYEKRETQRAAQEELLAQMVEPTVDVAPPAPKARKKRTNRKKAPVKRGE